MIDLTPAHNLARAAASNAATLAALAGGSIEMYAVVRPGAGVAAGAAPLVVVPLFSPAGTITDGVVTLTMPVEVLILTSGVALWARFKSTASALFDGDVSDNAGTGTVKLDRTQLYAGGILRMTSIVLG